MVERTASLYLAEMIEAIERIRGVLSGVSLTAFELDWEKRWLVESGVEIISEASRRLPDELKVRHPEIPWRRVAGIGNMLRHSYEHVAPDVLWKLAQADLQELEAVCRSEVEAAERRPKGQRTKPPPLQFLNAPRQGCPPEHEECGRDDEIAGCGSFRRALRRA